MKRCICYLADDFSKVETLPHSSVISSPEGLLNGEQIRNWVGNLKKQDESSIETIAFATTSLYLIRELDLQKVDVLYYYYKSDGTVVSCTSIDDLPIPLEILDRELEQSDRFMRSNTPNLT